MIKTVLIEDEVQQRIALKEILKMTCPEIKIVGEAETIQSGIEILKIHEPELVFMDIQLRDGLSFEILEKWKLSNENTTKDFHVVFLTAYNQYALKAIKFSALDYLLKPIDPEELVQAVARFKIQRQNKVEKAQYELLFSQLKAGHEIQKKMVINAADRMHIVTISDIIRCESKDNYTQVIIKDDKPILVSKTLKEYEEMLEPLGFLRIHQSHLINLDYLKTFLKNDGGSVVLTNDEIIPVSYRKKDHLLEILKSL